MKRHKNIFNKIIDPNNFYEAYRKTSLGKKDKIEYLKFYQWEHRNISELIKDITDGSYIPSEPTHFPVFDPKPRSIVALKFRDRIVQHAMFALLNPIFNKTFLPNSYACRVGYGAHRASRDVQSSMRKYEGGWYLKTDFSKYFKSIRRDIVWEEIDKKIGCNKTKRLIEKFVPRDGVGINIGELMSQLLANVMGNKVDMFIKHNLKVKCFYRYMDDIVLFGNRKEEMVEIKNKLEEFCNDLGLRFSKWMIKPLRTGINFVGYRIWKTHKLIRKDSIQRSKRKLKRLKGEDLKMFIGSWNGHIKHANSYNLRKKLGLVVDNKK